MPGIYDFSAKSLVGEEVSLQRFEGQVLLIVNTASQCGFTPQYRGREELHREFASRGFAVPGFPCNHFSRQAPGTAGQISALRTSKYDLTFPMFDKVDVNGANAHPLYDYLKRDRSGLLGSSIKWNFTKFLVDRAGQVTPGHAPTTSPESLNKYIEALR